MYVDIADPQSGTFQGRAFFQQLVTNQRAINAQTVDPITGLTGITQPSIVIRNAALFTSVRLGEGELLVGGAASPTPLAPPAAPTVFTVLGIDAGDTTPSWVTPDVYTKRRAMMEAIITANIYTP